MSNWVSEVVLKWRDEGVEINPGATIDSILAAETILGFNFPDDFKDLYLVINGFKDFDWQQHLFTFWSLERIIEEHGKWGDKEFIGFSDFLLASHAIGFKRSQKGIFKSYDEFNPIAQTFENVVAMINSGSKSIY